MDKILIFGATSAIAQETAKLWAKEGKNLFLIGRDPVRLTAVEKDLKVRGAKVRGSLVCDLNLTHQHDSLIETAEKKLEGIDGVLIAHGTLGEQKECEKEYEMALREIESNFLSQVSILTRIANIFEKNKKGTIVVITSVAGDRGRQSNYVYGASKGALSLFLQGLRNRLYSSQIQVLTVKPGFVDTPMTVHLSKGPLFVPPSTIAKGIMKGIKHRKDMIYLPWFWWIIMIVIRSIPECVFKKLKL